MRIVLFVSAAVLTGCANPTPPQALACESLTRVASEASTILSAQPVTAATKIGEANVDAKFCRVQGVARPSPDSDIRFEVWLPQDWTGRFKLNGTGGYAG